MSRPVSPELALAFACCRWPRSDAGDAALRAAAGGAIDWERFAGVIARNRISALAKDALDRAGVEPPAEIAAQLAQGQSNAAFGSLRLARESIRLQRAFDAAGLPALIVKGAPMAMLSYGDLGRKESWDIDLLTDELSVPAARRLLEQSGYGLSNPVGLDASQFARFVPHAIEAAFRNPVTGISMELHWRLVDNDLLLARVGLGSETQSVALGAGASSGSVRTLVDAPLFAYLCVHGAKHNWGRLKWLADVGAFLGSRSVPEVERLYRVTCKYGARRPAGLALLLCQRHLGLELATGLASELNSDRIIVALVANVLAGLEYGEGSVEHLGYTRPWWRTRIAAFLLSGDRAHVGRELRSVWTSSFDRARVALPRRLAFVYHLLRIPLWLLRLGGRFVRRTGVR